MGFLHLSAEIVIHLAGLLCTEDINSLRKAIPYFCEIIEPSTVYPWRYRWRKFGRYYEQSLVSKNQARSGNALESMLISLLEELTLSQSNRVEIKDVYKAITYLENPEVCGTLRLRPIWDSATELTVPWLISRRILEVEMGEYAPFDLVEAILPEVSRNSSFAFFTAYLLNTSLTPLELSVKLRKCKEGSVTLSDSALLEYFGFLSTFLRVHQLSCGLWLRTESGTPCNVNQNMAILRSRVDDFLRVAFTSPHVQSVPLSRSGSTNSFASSAELSITSLTKEQAEMVVSDAYKGSYTRVIAYAGSGKTTCLVEYAAARPEQKILYIAYNKTARDDAERRFGARPGAVMCRTFHSIAYEALKYTSPALYLHYFRQRKENGCGQLTDKEVMRILSLEAIPLKELFMDATFGGPKKQKKTQDYHHEAAEAVLKTVDSFLHSTQSAIELKNVPADTEEFYFFRTNILSLAKRLWTSILEGMTSKISHDVMVKLLALNPGADKYVFFGCDVIMLDEAQDSDDCMAQILMRQRARCGIIIVGDPHQRIYEFRGAKNVLFRDEKYKPSREMHLTASFRFGSRIAHFANSILTTLKETTLMNGIRDEQSDEGVFQLVGPVKCQPLRAWKALRPTIIFRKNSSALEFWVIEARQETGLKYFVKGNILSRRILRMLSKANITIDKDVVGDQLSQKIKVIEEVENNTGGIVEDADSTTDELESIAKECTSWQTGMITPGIIKACLANTVLSEEEADVILTTAHQTKGLEYDNVVVDGDFDVGGACVSSRSNSENEILNLFYVACTRARKRLFLPHKLWSIFKMEHGMYRIFISPSQGRPDALCPVCRLGGITGDRSGGKSYKLGNIILLGFESLAPIAFAYQSDSIITGAAPVPELMPSGRLEDVICCIKCAIGWFLTDSCTNQSLYQFAHHVQCQIMYTRARHGVDFCPTCDPGRLESYRDVAITDAMRDTYVVRAITKSRQQLSEFRTEGIPVDTDAWCMRIVSRRLRRDLRQYLRH